MMGDVANKIFFLWFLLLPELIPMDADGLEIRVIGSRYAVAH
jgi:hypothetical protein